MIVCFDIVRIQNIADGDGCKVKFWVENAMQK